MHFGMLRFVQIWGGGGGGGKRGINVIAEISLRVLMQSYLFFR